MINAGDYQPGNEADHRAENTACIHKPDQEITDPNISLQLLKDGNKRYVANQTLRCDINDTDRELLSEGQKPFAVILTCSDSRVSPEIYFDQKLGDIFVIRNAGGIADMTALGSIEYAVVYLRVLLVCVVGHSKCGAVSAVVREGEYPDNLRAILDAIKANISENESVNDAINKNISSTVARVRRNAVISENHAIVVGAYYDIRTGIVAWI